MTRKAFACSQKKEKQVQLFTTGLMKPLRTDVELQNPTNLQTAMSLAKAYEVWLLEEPTKPKPPM